MRLAGDEENLPFAPESFDLAVSALSLQYLNDLPGALVQLRRVLQPNGLFLGCLLGGQSLYELRTALAVAESELSGGISPRVVPFADVRDMGGLLQRAGFALPVADCEPLTVRYDTLFDLMRELRAMGRPMRSWRGCASLRQKVSSCAPRKSTRTGSRIETAACARPSR